MRRREFITLLGGAAAAWPLAARAQQAGMPVIGFLNGCDRSAGYARMVRCVSQGLKEAGLCRGPERCDRISLGGRSLRSTAGDGRRSCRARQVAVLAATSTPAALVAKAATTTIPIVFTAGGDPVRLGLVASLSRPGRKRHWRERTDQRKRPKRLELLHAIGPNATVIGLLINPTNPSAETVTRDLRWPQQALGCRSRYCTRAPKREIDQAFTAFSQTARRCAYCWRRYALCRVRRAIGSHFRSAHSVPAIFDFQPFVETAV